MSVHSEQSIHSQPLESPGSGFESFSTAQQQPYEAQAADVERETTRNALAPGKPFGDLYTARPSIFIVPITHKEEIVYRQRHWVTATTFSDDYQNLPDIPPKGIRIGILNVGVYDETGESIVEWLKQTSPFYNVSGLDMIPYKLPWREFWPVTKDTGFNLLENLLGMKRLARLNAHRLQELCQKRAIPPNNIFIAQSNIFESSLPSRPYPDRFYMLHEEGRSCPLQSSGRT